MPYSNSTSSRNAPPDLAGQAFEEAMASVPIGYLESYPLPALVCCVRTGRVRKEAYATASDRPETSSRPALVTHDTDGTAVRGSRSGSAHSATSSIASSATPTPYATSSPTPSASPYGMMSPTMSNDLYGWSANVSTSRGNSFGSTTSLAPSWISSFGGSQASTTTSSASMSRSESRNTTMSSGAGWSWRPPPLEEYDPDEEDERDDDVLPLHSVSTGSRLSGRGGSPYATMTTVTVNRPYGSTSCVWHNAQWSKVVGDAPLAAVVDPVTFMALEGWIEADIETRNDNSRVSRDSTQFNLDVRGASLQLIKTRHDKHPPGTLLWIITATHLTERANRSQPGDLFMPSASMRSLSSDGRFDVDSPVSTPPIAPILSPSVAPDDPNACVNLLKTLDWSKTAIGPRSKWGPEISSMVALVFLTVTPDAVWVGPDLIGVYNQQFAALCEHPKSFGKSLRDTWSVTWDEVGPLVDKALSGEPVERGTGPMLYQRNDRGRFIEKHHSFSLHPIIDKAGKVQGLWNPTVDHTDRVLAERRLHTSSRLVEEVAFSRTPHELFQTTASVLAHNPADAPFVMLYSVKQAGGAPALNMPTESRDFDLELQLEASVGVPGGHPSAAEKIHFSSLHVNSVSGSFMEECLAERMGLVQLEPTANGVHHGRPSSPTLSQPGSVHSRSSVQSRSTMHSRSTTYSRASSRRGASSANDNSSWPIRQALETRQTVLVDHIQDLIKGFPIRQWDELPDQAIVIPINNEPENKVPQAVMVMGLNLRRPFDQAYKDWVYMMRGYLASTLGAVTAFEEDVRLRLEKEKLERAKTAWFRGAAHEFRTPLTLVAGPLEDLLQTKLSSSQRKQLQIAHRNILRLGQLMTSLLDLTRLESGKVDARFIPTDLAEFVTELAGVFRPAFEKLKIRFCVDTESHDAVCVDPVLLEIVVTHLVINALKLTDQGTVSIRLAYTHDRANIIVSDTGAGISEDDMLSATDFFHRIQTADNRGSEATGVGLALIKEIVRLHDGKLFIHTKTDREDNRGSGSVFTASFPLSNEANVDTLVTVPFGVYAKQVAQDIKAWAKDESSMEDSGVFEPNAGANQTNSDTSGGLTTSSSGFTDGLMFEREDVLLVVDNNAEMRSYIKALFERFCTVVEAPSGEEALQLVKTVKPSLVISELVMRTMSGLELLQELRLDEDLRFTPMVLLSATTDDDERVAAFLAGVDDFISKPFKPRELLLRVHLHMQMGKKRAKLERLFSQRELELSVLSDYCPSGIMRTDGNGKVIYANESFRTPAGMTCGEDPWRWFEFCDDESRPHVQRVWSEVLTGGLPATTLQWKWHTGRTRSAVLIRLDVVRPGMSGLLMCVTDITYQEERIEEAQRRRAEAEESKHQQELLVDLTSHEIRTPVSAILQCSSLVKENLVALKEQLRFAGAGGFKPSAAMLADLEEDVEALESIYQCGLVQERIAGDVLSLARIQLDMLSLHYVEMDLRKEAKKVLSVFASEAKMKKIDIVLKIDGSLEALQIRSIKTDPVRLGQVLTNLTANAIRFTAAAATRKITVHYGVGTEPPLPGTFFSPPSVPLPPVTPLPEDTPVYLFVSVSDTGPGMTPAEQKMLFKRFQQSNKMIHTRYGGSGLGLFICKKITELLGGGIEVQSEIGVGSTFRFWIKTHTVAPAVAVGASSLAIPGPETLQVGISTSTGPSTPVLVEPEHEAEPLRLLIVEDNIINQTVLKRQLVKAGFVCDTANDGQEALVRIHEANRECRHNTPGRLGGYDVVLMDLEMPVMDGLTAVGHIRDAEAAGMLRPQLVIALTGNARQGQIDQALAGGMNDVVIKPYRLPDLIAKMRSASAEHRKRFAQVEDWRGQSLRVDEAPPTPSPGPSPRPGARDLVSAETTYVLVPPVGQ